VTRLIPLLALMLLLSPPARAQDDAGETGFLIRSDVQEVVIDLIVRDKKGEVLTDLTAEEIAVSEEGEAQQIVSFRRVSGGRLERLGGSGAPGGVGPGSVSAESVSAGSQMRLAQLVTLVFERLGNTSRNLAYRAAKDFIESEMRDNVYVSVYVLDRRLLPIQEFTNDRDALMKAVETATGRNKTNFFAESENVQRRLEEFLQKSNSPTLQQALNANQVGGAQSAPDIDTMLAQRAYEIAQRSEQMAQEAEAGGSIFSLIALVRSLDELVGRKTVLLFSEGFQVPANFTSHLDGMISEANRAQVSFYTVDARGLETGSQLDQAKRMLNDAARNSRSQQELSNSGQQRGFSQAEIQALDNAQASIRGNRQGTLQEIAARTGGEFVGNTNNFSKPIARITEDIFSYYEVTYRPPIEQFDGRFRGVSVAVSRPDVEVHTRDGYYALPPNAGDVVTVPFELPMIAKLAEDPPPSDLDFATQFLEFRHPKTGGALLTIAARLPLSEVEFTTRQQENPQAKKKKDRVKTVYDARFSVLGQLKDETDVVVKRTSQDVPLSGDVERLDGLKLANFRLYKTWEVGPGSYRLEAAAHDQTSGKFGAMKTGVVIEPSSGVGVSSLTLIERVDPKPEAQAEGEDAEEPDPLAVPNPLEFALGTVVPAQTRILSKAAGGNVSYYFVVYPDSDSKEKPALKMEYYLDGQLVGAGEPELPAPAEDGTIPYIATTPTAAFPPGDYMMVVQVLQGEGTAERNAYFKIVE